MNPRIVNRLAITSILALALALPSGVLAADLEIREIMYDLDGTDSSREWLEIRNVSGATIDLADWHFYENDVNHRLTPAEDGESLNLSSGDYAVIAQDPAAFYDDHPEVSALVVDSAFTLSNDGETIALSTPEEEVVGEVTYDPADGADGNGLSLQRNQGEWIAADPTPGEVNATAETEVDDDDADSSSNDLDMMDPREEISLGSEEVSIEAGEDELAIAGLPVELSGFIEGASEHRLEELEFSWSLGNGVTEGGQEVTYTYDYPGEYMAAFRVDTDDGVYTDGLTVEVIEPNVRIAEVKAGDDPYIALENDTSHAIDLAGWLLQAAGETFTFPERTIHLEDQRLIIPGSVSGLSGQRVTLLLPDETVVASSTPEEFGSDQSDPANTSRQDTTLTTQSAGSPSQPQPDNPPAEEEGNDQSTDTSDDTDSASGTVAGTTTAATGSVSLADAFGSEAQAAVGSSQGQVDMFWQWAGMLILLLVITVGTAILLRRVSKSGDDPSVQAAKFDINEI